MVKDFGGVAGIGLRCSSSAAFFTQKWTVDFGLGGCKESAIILRDQPAFHNALMRLLSAGGSREERNLTSSDGRRTFFFIVLFYSNLIKASKTKGPKRMDDL